MLSIGFKDNLLLFLFLLQPDREDELRRIEEGGGKVINWNGARVFGVLAMSRAIGLPFTLILYFIRNVWFSCCKYLSIYIDINFRLYPDRGSTKYLVDHIDNFFVSRCFEPLILKKFY